MVDRTSGLDPEQLDELVWRIEEQLEEPWHKGIGRPKDLSMREAVVVASGYMRQNIIQEVWAEIFDTSQPVISGIIAKFTALIEESTEEERPTAEEAEEAVAREQTVLVDGFLAPTWSWRDTPELWSGKHKTTGFNGQAISNLRGDLLFVSEPVTGHNHDMTALAETETAMSWRLLSAESATRAIRARASSPRLRSRKAGNCLTGRRNSMPR